MKNKEGILKQFLTYRRAKNLLDKISKIKTTLWDIRIIEEKDNKKKLEIRIAKTFWDAEKFSELMELLMKESVKHNLWIHGCQDGYNADLKISIEVKG